MERVGLGLGSNLGDRAGEIRAALKAISELSETQIVAKSSLYKTPPWGIEDQPPFLNAAALIDTGLSPDDLLTEIKRIEKTLGRRPSVRWGPRHIDIDILFYGTVSCSDERLTLPHKALFDRAFVLVPLSEICGDLEIAGQSVKTAARVHPDSPIVMPHFEEL